MGKAEKVTEVGLVEVWAMFWPKKNWDVNVAELIAWLEDERVQAYMEGVAAGLNAARTAKDHVLTRKESK